MNHTTSLFRINGFVAVLALLSAGVLTGCDYCSPVLLASIAGAIVYRFARPLRDAMQKQAFNQ